MPAESLWLSLELQHGRNLPVSYQCTLAEETLQHFSWSAQHDCNSTHSNLNKPWPSHRGSQRNAAIGAAPFLGSSIPPLCRAIILHRGASAICLHCLQLACRAGICTGLHWVGLMSSPCRQKAELKLQRLAARSCSKCLCPAASRDSHSSWGH